MRIRDEHLYHGAALNQIAEHKQFTAINSLKVKGHVSRSAFKVNASITVYLKYASRPNKSFQEYVFTFNQDHLTELSDIAEIGDELYLALVCVKDCEICCLGYRDFAKMIQQRRKSFGGDEDQYTVLATIEVGKAFRVYMNQPGKKGTRLGTPKSVARNRFPNALFR